MHSWFYSLVFKVTSIPDVHASLLPKSVSTVEAGCHILDYRLATSVVK